MEIRQLIEEFDRFLGEGYLGYAIIKLSPSRTYVEEIKEGKYKVEDVVVEYQINEVSFKNAGYLEVDMTDFNKKAVELLAGEDEDLSVDGIEVREISVGTADVFVDSSIKGGDTFETYGNYEKYPINVYFEVAHKDTVAVESLELPAKFIVSPELAEFVQEIMEEN